MQDIHTMLAEMHRPRLLMRAARIGAQDYRRTAHLPRLLGYGVLPRPAAALMKLIGIEAQLETERAEGDASYSLTRHVDVLIAIVGEARDLRHAQAASHVVVPLR
ncbi:DUF6477 family protein [Sulfitobacter sp. S190]|uniref:DUF6477 family protein n=1 Tax=Sulfitobacter sp. S190 TaxID=2867022 RepID=UPI0021A82166|nr:DUF6477 family protein [Sulfitobacter sp. S190]UWR20854.1 hypothetical protein K3756_08910 [Sulfitobacter sp. S190]